MTPTSHIPNTRQLDELAVFVHGALVSLHLLGVLHNLKKHNWFDVVAHTSAAAYDCWAVNRHLKALSAQNE